MRIQMKEIAVLGYCIIACAANTGSGFARGAEDLQSPQNKASKPAQWPLQLEMRVPFEPTAFPSGPHFCVLYELHLVNFGPTPLSLNRIEVLDADAGTAHPIASFEAEALEAMLQPLGASRFLTAHKGSYSPAA